MKMKRRTLIKSLTTAVATFAIGGKTMATGYNYLENETLKGNVNHAVCQWTFGHLSTEELCMAVKKIGFNAIDLTGPKEWETMKKYNIYSSMCNGADIGLEKGWCDKQYHTALLKNYNEYIDLVAAAGYKNLICFSGNKNGMDDEIGKNNCAEGLKKIMAYAEKKNVTIQMEVFNSKIDHKDYMADKTAWAIDLVKKIDSPNFKILYDIYHMQINEGDVIRTIQNNHQYFGHYHTAGVPGRHEIDDTQELFYPAIMKAIKETGYKGYVGQEFIPTGKTNDEKYKALKKAIKICDV
jgi:hydroxypyruvate isomerase